MDALVRISDYFHDGKNTTLILCSSATVLLVTYWLKKYLEERKYFEKMNLPGPKPWPLIGNMDQLIRYGMHETDMRLVKTYGNMYGYFEGTFPIIMTTDVKFIKSYLIKDFNSFVNRRVFYIISRQFENQKLYLNF